MPTVALRYAVENTSEDSVTVDGFAVLQPGEAREFSEQDVYNFTSLRGLRPNQVHMPRGVEVFIIVSQTSEGK